MNSDKKALALGGGGSRGSYEAGVCKALNQLNKKFDIVTGTSIGAICGAIYVQDAVDELCTWMSHFTQGSVAENLFVFKNQYKVQDDVNKPVNDFLSEYMADGPSIDPLKQNLEQIFDFQKFKNSPLEFACISYNLTDNHMAVFNKNDMTQENAVEEILSSTAYFPAFNLVKMNDCYYLDGGYCSVKPWNLAAQMGATDILAVVLKNYDEQPENLSQEGTFFIYPIMKLAYFLDFDGATLAKQGKQGYLETLKYLDQAPGYLYTFYPEDWNHMVHLEKLVLDLVVEDGKEELLEKYPKLLEKFYQFLLGYVPRPLKNQYSEQYMFGRLLECLGLIAGIDVFEQIHFKDFVYQILQKFNSFKENPNLLPQWQMFTAMEQTGLKDLMVFFHTALACYGQKLPENFEVIKAKFIEPYYLAWAWHLMEKFQLVFYL